jgi:REP element-mobilizing transposase RayT
MARKPRIHAPGACYHVILRGNGKQDIFFDAPDRYRFYLLLQEGVERFGHRIHAFCLMTNHVHLAVQVADQPLSRIMQNLSFRYTRWVNGRHDRSGHLFQGRYKAVLIDGDAYLLELVRYIHLNPVRAGMVSSPGAYPWSGHKAYCGQETLPWLTTDVTLAMLSARRNTAIRAYVAFVNDGIGTGRRGEFHGEKADDSRFLGGDEFVSNLVGAGAKLPDKISVADILAVVCDRYGVAPEMLAQPGKQRALSHARGMAAWIVQDLPSCSLTELSRCTGRDLSSLSAAAQRLHVRSVGDVSLLEEKNRIVAEIAIYKA